MTCLNSNSEGAIVEGLQSLLGPVLCAFGKDQNRYSFCENFFEMFHAFSSAFVARPIHDHTCCLSDPAKDWNLLEFLFCKWPKLRGDSQRNAREIEIACVVTDVYISFAFLDVFSSFNPINDSIKLAKGPRPYFQEKISDSSSFIAKYKWQQYPWKVDDHKNGKDHQDPEEI